MADNSAVESTLGERKRAINCLKVLSKLGAGLLTVSEKMEKEIKEVLEPLDLSESESLQEDSEYENEEKTPHENQDKNHQKLLKDISKLSAGKKRNIKKSVRSEPSKDVSEFTWASSKAEKIELHDLMQSISGATAANSDLRKNLKKLEEKGKVIDVPLPKPQQDKIERAVAYDENVKEVSVWEPTVINNRSAEHLSFPMQSYVPPRPSIKGMVARKKVSGRKNALELEIEAVLKGSSYVLERNGKELTAAEEDALRNVDVEEALARRKELQRLRVLQSYYEAKCKRMKKIKSKKYHRILKKAEKKKQEKTDLEELAKSDPTLFQSELEKAERIRALERANLRHRNASKWAKNMITKGHMSTKDKQAINEQLRISRTMTEHKLQLSDSEEDAEAVDDGNENELKLLSRESILEDNPWLLGSEEKKSHEKETRAAPLRLKKLEPIANEDLDVHESEPEGNEASSGEEWDEAGKIEDSQEKSMKSRKKKKPTKDSGVVKKTKQRKAKESPATPKPDAVREDIENVSKSRKPEPSKPENNFPLSSTVVSVSDFLSGGGVTEEQSSAVNEKSAITSRLKRAKGSHRRNKGSTEMTMPKEKPKQDSNENLTPSQFLNVEKAAAELLPASEDEADSDVGEDQTLMMTIREAFASDDVIEEFAFEKRDVIEKSKPKDIDLTIPGWGEWGGAGVQPSKKKLRKFVKKGKPAPPRKDSKLPLVIINEDRSSKFAKTQVSSVPFPFSDKEQFEKSIRQPIGPQWNTPSITSKLIEPRVSVAKGTVIEPIKATKAIKKRRAANWHKTENDMSDLKVKKKKGPSL